jgi:hypothetical protein
LRFWLGESFGGFDGGVPSSLYAGFFIQGMRFPTAVITDLRTVM